MYKTLRVETPKPGVLSVTLNRPEIRNAFNEQMIQELNQIFTQDVLKPEVRLVVLRGEGKVFCAGGDLNWMKKSIALTGEANRHDTRVLTHMFRAMNECPKPVIGVIQGAAIGGGVGLVSVCDWVIAESATQLSLSEVRLGIVPACIGPFVVSKIGASFARALFVSAERFDAKRALEIGLVHEVVTGEAALQASLERLLGNMLQCGPHAMETAKKLVLDLTWPEKRSAIADCYEYAAQTLADLRVLPEGQEGVRAFLEKRKPAWIDS